MDSEQLERQLGEFKRACSTEGCEITKFDFEPAYAGDSSSSFVVKMRVNTSWLNQFSSIGRALDRLTEILFKTTDSQTRQKIFVLSIDER